MYKKTVVVVMLCVSRARTSHHIDLHFMRSRVIPESSSLVYTCIRRIPPPSSFFHGFIFSRSRPGTTFSTVSWCLLGSRPCQVFRSGEPLFPRGFNMTHRRMQTENWQLLSFLFAQGSVESTHKVPTSHCHTKDCHAAVVSLG